MSITQLSASLRALLPGPRDWADVRRNPRADLVAGLTVAVVALPLALAFGVASGLGAHAGLITAVVAGALAAIFGGSNLQVSGPTGAMTVVLIPIVHRFGPSGVLLVGLLAGALLMAAALLRIGRAARYLPAPVIEGFTAGIAVVIVLQQVPAMLGVPGGTGEAWRSAWDALRAYLAAPRPEPLLITLAVAAAILAGVRWRPGLPMSLGAVALATVVVKSTGLHVDLLGALPSGLPAPSLHFVDAGMILTLLPSALAVAALGALESLLSATVADGMTVDEQHDPDRELFGQGVANLAAPLFGGVPATAAIARTAVNVRAGATSRLAALIHAVTIAVIVFAAGPLVGGIPLAALAGVLLATCVQMVEMGSLLSLARATRADALVLGLTFAITVAWNLVVAVAVGVAVAIVLALRSVSRSAQVRQVPLGDEPTRGDPDLLPERIVAYRIDGPLLFAAAHRFLIALTEVGDVRVVIVRLSRISSVDATGARVLGDAVRRLERRGITVLLSGLRPEHDPVFSALGAVDHLRASGRVFADTREAIAYAKAAVVERSAA